MVKQVRRVLLLFAAVVMLSAGLPAPAAQAAKLASGFRKENGVIYYYTGTNHQRYEKKGWAKIDGKKYYFRGDYTAATGLQKIGKNTYLFSGTGEMLTGEQKSGGSTYYLAVDGAVEGSRRGKKFFKADGTAMDREETYEFETYLRAKKQVAKLVNDRMSEEKKLKKCFKWVLKRPYITKRKFTTKKGWIPLYANDHFRGAGGTCMADASAFAYMAKALGYKDVYVCMNKVKKGGHAWTEIKGRAYDPRFAKSRSFKKNYGVTYKVFCMKPRYRWKIA